MPPYVLRLSIAMYLFIAVVIPLLLATPFAHAAAGHDHNEAYYQGLWCARQGGITEVRLPDKARVDCLTSKAAIEVDFAEKAWKEGVGQALWYALVTRRKPGVLVIMERESDCKYLTRLKGIVNWTQPEIMVWETGAFAYNCPAGDWLNIDPVEPPPPHILPVMPPKPYIPPGPYIHPKPTFDPAYEDPTIYLPELPPDQDDYRYFK